MLAACHFSFFVYCLEELWVAALSIAGDGQPREAAPWSGEVKFCSAASTALARVWTSSILSSAKDSDNGLFIQHQEIYVWYRNPIIYR